MIKEQLSQHKEYTVIKYDAWENSFYSEPLVSVLSCIIEGLKEKLSTLRGYKKVFIETGKKVGENLLNKLSEKTGKIGTVATITKSIIDLLPTVNNALKIDGDNVTKEFVSYKTLLNEVKEKLNLITTDEEYEGKQNKLIILVDEIDRCLPEEQLKILERLHHLFDIKNCAVICSLNKKSIFNSFETAYGVDGEEYLRKFFDFNYTLEPKQSVYLESLLRDFYVSLHSICEKATEEPVRCAYQCLSYGMERVVDGVDNRELFRYSEVLNRVCNDFGWQNLDEHSVFFIIVALFIRKEISKDFLSKKQIINNQKDFNESMPNGSFDSPFDGEMPYYDYIEEHLGIERKNLPKEFYPVSSYKVSKIPEYSWYFNEIICYSLGKQFNGNEMRAFFHERTVYPEDCQKLRELVIRYGGE